MFTFTSISDYTAQKVRMTVNNWDGSGRKWSRPNTGTTPEEVSREITQNLRVGNQQFILTRVSD
jgi:hypothetical protein